MMRTMLISYKFVYLDRCHDQKRHSKKNSNVNLKYDPVFNVFPHFNGYTNFSKLNNYNIDYRINATSC